ncbi:multidrug transporter [Bacillus sp. MMSF_3328]|uniref:multidrug transporter n=1 Tax=Bacillus sp. MMSF_3328 TaxID=3047080 RepID=UPI00273FEC8C|nr:multidrug transporter [Bacillus sp. MMSF_3328]
MFEEVSFIQLQNRHIIKKALVFAVEGTQTPAGNSGRVETPQRSARRLRLRPAESEVPGTENTSPI